MDRIRYAGKIWTVEETLLNDKRSWVLLTCTETKETQTELRYVVTSAGCWV